MAAESGSSKLAKLRKFRKKRNYNPDALEKIKSRKKKKEGAEDKLSGVGFDGGKSSKPAGRTRTKHIRLENADVKFEENDLMTQFDGCWVSREACGRLVCARDKLIRRDLDETARERKMKQLLRREHRKLKLTLIGTLTKNALSARERRSFLQQQTALEKTDEGAEKTPRRKGTPAKTSGLRLSHDSCISGDTDGAQSMEKFEGFWVSSEGAERLRALKEKLASGDAANATAALRRARRREERLLKSAGRLVCAKCGGRGHQTAVCTATAVNAAASGGNICFRCGSSAHRLADCPEKHAPNSSQDALPFATCFLCRQTGHMARHCPVNGAEHTSSGVTSNHKQYQHKAAAEKTRTAMTAIPSWRGTEHDGVGATNTSSNGSHHSNKHIRF